MDKDLQTTPSSRLPASAILTQNGNKNTQIAHASTVNIIVTGQQAGASPVSVQGALNKEYYNLFVIGGETFLPLNSGHFLITKDRALTENVSPEIKDIVDSLSPESIAFIKTLPTIFASENTYYGRSDDTQQAFFGVVTDVRVQDNGIKIYYHTLNPIPQQILNDHALKFSITGRPAFNELNRTHWTIKRINLVEELRDAGIIVYAP